MTTIAHIFLYETEICNEIAKILLEGTGIINGLKDDTYRFVLVYDNSIDKNGNIIRGLGNVFRLYAILDMFNNYFADHKIDLKASKLVSGSITYIKFEKFMRMNLISRDKGKEDIGRDIIDDEKYDIFKKGEKKGE